MESSSIFDDSGPVMHALAAQMGTSPLVLVEAMRVMRTEDPDKFAEWQRAVSRFETGMRSVADGAERVAPPATKYVNPWYLGTNASLSMFAVFSHYGSDHSCARTIGGYACAATGALLFQKYHSLMSKSWITRCKIVTNNIVTAAMNFPEAHICVDPSGPGMAWIGDQRRICDTIDPRRWPSLSICSDYRTCREHADAVLIDHTTARVLTTDIPVVLDHAQATDAAGVYLFSPMINEEHQTAVFRVSDHSGFFVTDNKVQWVFDTPSGLKVDQNFPLYSVGELLDLLHVNHYQRAHQYVAFPEEYRVMHQTYAVTRAPWGTLPEVPDYQGCLLNEKRGLYAKVLYPKFTQTSLSIVPMYADAKLVQRVRGEVLKLEKTTSDPIKRFAVIFSLVRDYFTRIIADNLMQVYTVENATLVDIQNISWGLFMQCESDRLTILRATKNHVPTAKSISEALRGIWRACNRIVDDQYNRLIDRFVEYFLGQKVFPNFVSVVRNVSWPRRTRSVTLSYHDDEVVIADDFVELDTGLDEVWDNHFLRMFGPQLEEVCPIVDADELRDDPPPVFDHFKRSESKVPELDWTDVDLEIVGDKISRDRRVVLESSPAELIFSIDDSHPHRDFDRPP